MSERGESDPEPGAEGSRTFHPEDLEVPDEEKTGPGWTRTGMPYPYTPPAPYGEKRAGEGERSDEDAED